MHARARQVMIVGLLSVACGRIAGIDGYEAEESRWLCLGRPVTGSTGSGSFRLAITARKLGQTEGGLPDATVTLCRKIDSDCSDWDDERVTDGNGSVTFEVPAGFGGFVRITKADEGLLPEEQIMPSLYYVSPNVNSDQDVVVQMTNALLRDAAMSQVGVAFREGHALILMNAFDCNNAPARGVTFETTAADAETTAFFVRNGLPDTAATLTDPTGYGGFVNVVPGIASVTARVGETGRMIGTIGVTIGTNTFIQTRFVPSGWPP